eukprot:GFYU01006415.1.p1 GENE.GFYU01006415.1~~GFYU01006415.1.p1  ORF type:complete len:465 (-),score=80.14 GFYU01006415.1:42-1436(-)
MVPVTFSAISGESLKGGLTQQTLTMYRVYNLVYTVWLKPKLNRLLQLYKSFDKKFPILKFLFLSMVIRQFEGIFKRYASILYARFRSTSVGGYIADRTHAGAMHLAGHQLDRFFSWLNALDIRRFVRELHFTDGWGQPEELGEQCYHEIVNEPIPRIHVKFDSGWVKQDNIIFREGSFKSPVAHVLPDHMQVSHFRWVMPASCATNPKDPETIVDMNTKIVILLAASGEQGYSRRMGLAFVLAQESNIGTVILEAPYYGKRSDPSTSNPVVVKSVDGLLKLGAGMIQEARAMVGWLKRQGFNKLGVSGRSMGGHISSLVATHTPFPIAIAPCMVTHSCAEVWCEGVMSRRCDWEELARLRGIEVEEARKRVRQIYHSLTDLTQFKPPPGVKAAVMLNASHDGYIARQSGQMLHEHWEGAEMTYVDGGHVLTFITKTDEYVKTIVKSFQRLEHHYGHELHAPFDE